MKKERGLDSPRSLTDGFTFGTSLPGFGRVHL